MHIKELNPKSNKNFAFAICHVEIKPMTAKRGDVTTTFFLTPNTLLVFKNIV